MKTNTTTAIQRTVLSPTGTTMAAREWDPHADTVSYERAMYTVTSDEGAVMEAAEEVAHRLEETANASFR